MAENAQYLTLGIDQEIFGIDIRYVREILDLRPISKLPHAPDFLMGMIDVRGAGFPIVDLRTKLGLPRVDATEATRIIILDVPVKGRTTGVGFVADRVFEVTGLDKGQTEAAPDVGGRWQSNYIAGIGRKGEAFIVVFDLERLMANDDLSSLAPPAGDLAA
ncbi:CheW protein [Bosea sp. LC85]|uniref:chemotaxis protein CheW n=1 Tax=Bosea sp. LC85 TaxID=1502851 RepID=UPI0004E301FB|nr:chemotaxis protein CheW [Bosea sp. LC85]KFC75633.1 CheW protein [Bosea sp. LC85]